MSFAEKLQAVRRREGYSQATAAALIRDFSVRTLQAWECEQQTPPLWAQWLVLEALGGAPYVKPKVRRAAGGGVLVGRQTPTTGAKGKDRAKP